VDIGATSVAAAVEIDGRASVFPMGSAAPAPAVVLRWDDGTFLTGEAAVRCTGAFPELAIHQIANWLGDPTPLTVGGLTHSAEGLTAHLLGAVVSRVVQTHRRPIDRVVLTHPAHWTTVRQESLRTAARLAGIEHSSIDLAPAPEAAAMAHNSTWAGEGGAPFAVYDLGGTSFEVSVLRPTHRRFELLGKPEAIKDLGGVNFDAALRTQVTTAAKVEVDDGATTDLARLNHECTKAKEGLSLCDEVVGPLRWGTDRTEVGVTREQFESIIEPLVTETINATNRALQSADVEPAELDRLIIAGGSSRIPMVAASVAEAFGLPVVAGPHPRHCVALGAACVPMLLMEP